MRWHIPDSSTSLPRMGNRFCPCDAMQSLQTPDCAWHGQCSPQEGSQANIFQCDYQADRPQLWQQWFVLLRCQVGQVMMAIMTCSQIQTCMWYLF